MESKINFAQTNFYIGLIKFYLIYLNRSCVWRLPGILIIDHVNSTSFNFLFSKSIDKMNIRLFSFCFVDKMINYYFEVEMHRFRLEARK